MMELSLAKRPAPPSSKYYKPLMLKDFLVDDLSSCSSSGFRSYPRRQCCTSTVRFLLEIDLKNKPTKQKQKLKNKKKNPAAGPLARNLILKQTGSGSGSGNAGTAGPISSFQRASLAIIKAVKHLPFGGNSSSPSKLKLGGILPRSFSRKFLSKRSFWKKNDHKKEIPMWRPIIHDHLTDEEEEEEKSNPPRDFIILSAAAGYIDGGNSSNSSTSESSTTSTTTNSWSDSDFTTSDHETLHSSTKIIPEEEKKTKHVLPIDGVVSSKLVGRGADNSTDVNHPATNHTCTNSNTTTHQSWPNEEKEQFSPVSVLDCPFVDDEEDEVSSSSPFQDRLARVEGTKKRLMKKITRFELLTPVNLTKRIAVSESDQDSNKLDHEETADQKASEFLELLKYSLMAAPSSLPDHHHPPPPPKNNNNNVINPNLEKLLLDFFKLGYLENKNYYSREEELLVIAKDWINGKIIYSDEQVLEWKVNEKNRETYIQDMERGGEWRRRRVNNNGSLDTKEKEEMAMEIEVEIFSTLISDLLDDLLL